MKKKTREEPGAQETVAKKIKKRRLQWFGHVERMEGERLPIAALHGHVVRKRSRSSRGRSGWTMSDGGEKRRRRLDQWFLNFLKLWPGTGFFIFFFVDLHHPLSW